MMTILQGCLIGGFFFLTLSGYMYVRYNMVVAKAKRLEKMFDDLYGGKDYIVTREGELIEYDEDTQE